jgi:putative colanic acid biosynthesis UDP-glucose lipid carrier transferase
MNFSFKRTLQLLFIFLDFLMLNLGYFLAQSIFEEGAEAQYYMRYTQFWWLINGFWLVLSWLGEVYATRNISFFERFLRVSLRVFGIWTGLALIYLFLPRVVQLSASLVLATIGFFLAGILINRFLYLFIRRWVKRTIYLKRKILILGYNSTARKFATQLAQEGLGIQIMGFVDDKIEKTDVATYPVYHGIADTLKISKQLRVTEVYSTIMPENNSRVYNLMQQADQELIRFRLVADFTQLIDRPIHVDFFHDMPLLSVRREPLEQEVNRVKKRVFDVLVSSFVTVFILSWLVPLIGLLIKLESPGPIFFIQLRSGKNNRPFRCYKFRSMGVNREANTTQATKNDKRVTRIGRILRKTSLDEFPQFLNVLQGHMSIVGPRPHMLKHTKDYSKLTDDYMIRQFLKPGITGWAQVNGYRGEITELHHIKKRVEYDLWYLEHWSLWLDLRIMFLTVYNVFKGEENAY